MALSSSSCTTSRRPSRRGTEHRRRQGLRDQLPRDPRPPRPLSADARTALGAGHRGRRHDRGRPSRPRPRPPPAAGTRSRSSLDDQWTFDLPEGASFEEGAAFLMAYLTAWIPLTRQVARRPRHARPRPCGRRRGRERGGRRRCAISGPRWSQPSARSAKAELPLSLGAIQRRHVRPARRRSVRSTSSSTRSVARCSRTRSRCCVLSARSSRSASPPAPGPPSIRRCSSAETSGCRASTSAG